MISAISQINFNSKYYNNSTKIKSKENKTENRENRSDNEIAADMLKGVQPNELKELQGRFIKNYFLGCIGIMAFLYLALAIYTKKIKIGHTAINGKYNFESLKNDPSIPMLKDCKSINKSLKQMLERQLKLTNADKEILEEAGAPNAASRFLLSGPPGVGKTYFSKVYAKTTDAEYLEVLFSDLNSKWAGEVEAKMSEMFNSLIRQAKKNPNKRYVVTINEIDSILLPIEHLTGESGSTHFASLRRERSIFVTYMDKLMQESPNITLIGTTNLSPKNKNLDSALMSRFLNIMEVPYPDKESIRAAIIKNLRTIKDSDKFVKENSEQINELAEIMAKRKYSFRNLEYMVNEAKLNFLEDKIDNKNSTFKFDYLKNAQELLKKTDGEKEQINKI